MCFLSLDFLNRCFHEVLEHRAYDLVMWIEIVMRLLGYDYAMVEYRLDILAIRATFACSINLVIILEIQVFEELTVLEHDC